MRVVVALVAVLALAAVVVSAQTVPSLADGMIVAKTMTTAKMVPRPKPKAHKKKVVLAPGEASKAAVKALPKAPKDQLIKWIRANLDGETEAGYVKIHQFLKGQLIFTFEDLLKLGPDGIRALTVNDKLRGMFVDLMINHIGKSRGVDDGMLVPTPKLVKVKSKKECPSKRPSFLQVAVNPAAPSPVGDWLRRALPDTKPLRMSRTILALERQTIRTFADLNRVGLEGVKKLLYVPDGVRTALRDAIIYHLGITDGHDDGLMVPAVRYVPPPPVKEESC